MGIYITTADVQGRLKDHFSGLYKLPADQVDLDADILSADSEVNASVGKRYALPIANATALAWLKTLALDLLAERAWVRGPGDEVPKKVATQAKTARDQLADIAAGKATIGGATALAESAAAGADAIVIAGNKPEFTRDQMEGF